MMAAGDDRKYVRSRAWRNCTGQLVRDEDGNRMTMPATADLTNRSILICGGETIPGTHTHSADDRQRSGDQDADNQRSRVAAEPGAR
jgi:hypothetical protein